MMVRDGWCVCLRKRTAGVLRGISIDGSILDRFVKRMVEPERVILEKFGQIYFGFRLVNNCFLCIRNGNDINLSPASFFLQGYSQNGSTFVSALGHQKNQSHTPHSMRTLFSGRFRTQTEIRNVSIGPSRSMGLKSIPSRNSSIICRKACCPLSWGILAAFSRASACA